MRYGAGCVWSAAAAVLLVVLVGVAFPAAAQDAGRGAPPLPVPVAAGGDGPVQDAGPGADPGPWPRVAVGFGAGGAFGGDLWRAVTDCGLGGDGARGSVCGASNPFWREWGEYLADADCVTRAGAGAACLDGTYPRAFGPAVEAATAFRIWRGLGAGVAGAWRARQGRIAVVAYFPDSLVAGAYQVLDSETGLEWGDVWSWHVGPRWTYRLSARTDVTVSAGPSWFSVRWPLVDDVAELRYEPGDYLRREPVFGRPVVVERRGSGFGWHAAGDLSWYPWGRIGLGVTGRWSRADVVLWREPDGGVPAPVGGLDVTFGLRLRF